MTIFQFYFLYVEKAIFYQKKYLEKLSLSYFFVWQVIRNALTKQQRPYRYALAFQTPHFDPKYLARAQQWIAIYLFYISEKYLQFRKKQNHLLRKVFGLPHTSKQIYLLRNYFFKLYISQSYMYITLEGIGKIVCIGVTNFANL